MITLKEVAELLGANVVCGADRLDKTIKLAFASDLMSDVLTIDTSQLLLITGLTNLQTIRTAEMSDIGAIVFVRNKKVAPEMLELAEQNGLVVLESNMSMYRACGVLYNAGIKPVY